MAMPVTTSVSNVIESGLINESDIEKRLVERLSDYGFKVLKLYTPGNTGTMDRMILRPRYSPGPPRFVELKRPGKKLRKLQAAIAIDWTARGCEVLKPCSTIADVEILCSYLIEEVMPDYAFATGDNVHE